MSANYVCKSCGIDIKYPARQDQDNQPMVDIVQADDHVTIRIWPTEWVYDEQGRPHQIVATDALVERIDHACTPGLNPPGVNFNQPATNDPNTSF